MESDAFAELMVRVVHYGSLGRCVLRFMCAKVVMRLETTTHGKVKRLNGVRILKKDHKILLKFVVNKIL